MALSLYLCLRRADEGCGGSEYVCVGVYECENAPFSPLKMTHKTSVTATYVVKEAWGVSLSALEDLWLSPLHTADHPHLGGVYKKEREFLLQRELS